MCLGGTYGSCASDKVDCRALPWYRDDVCKGDTYLEAGENGCVNCPNLRSICATSCNWCTTDGVAPTITTTIEPTTYSVYAGNLLNQTSSSLIFCTKLFLLAPKNDLMIYSTWFSVDPCTDVVSDCPHWKEYCQDHPKVRELCGATCNVCYGQGSKIYNIIQSIDILMRWIFFK